MTEYTHNVLRLVFDCNKNLRISLFLWILYSILKKNATHSVFEMADQNLQKMHILAKFFKFAPIWKQNIFLKLEFLSDLKNI